MVIEVASCHGSGSGQNPVLSQSPALSRIMCKLFVGDIALCPASSCEEIADATLWNYRSGQYWLTAGNTLFQAYCVTSISPSQSQGWMRVAYVSSSRGCPAGLEEWTVSGRKLCRKKVDTGCSSVIFPSHGVSYSKVCGRVYGYQKDTTDGFHREYHCPDCTIDQQYVDGVSITHGSPRQHIWTMAASYYGPYCRCHGNIHSDAPSFVGEDYFCEAEGTSTYTTTDRLWDGSGCLSGSERCCEKGPWFCKDLPQPTTDDIEFRLCADEGRGNEDVYIERIELYVQ